MFINTQTNKTTLHTTKKLTLVNELTRHANGIVISKYNTFQNTISTGYYQIDMWLLSQADGHLLW